MAKQNTATSSQLNPEDLFNELFEAIYKENIFSDNKDVADLIPRQKLVLIYEEYLRARQKPDFNFREFIDKYFEQYDRRAETAPLVDPAADVRQHIKSMWSILERDSKIDRGTLFSLPHSYIVPGGRFDEQFYWDSYFIMLGLAADDRWDMVKNIINNFTYMIDRYDFIPNANRTYFLSRSQPPFFGYMIELLASHEGQDVLVKYLPHIEKEYRFWMSGVSTDCKVVNTAVSRAVELERGVVLNRYFDNQTDPRPESFGEDISTASVSSDPNRLYLHLRAAAESGWDFSSRWLDDIHDLSTIKTADIIPIDLNSLLYSTEKMIAKGYQMLGQSDKETEFMQLAEKRRQAINQYCWSQTDNFFYDYNFFKKQNTGRDSLAAVYPLFTQLATDQQAAAVARRIKKDFLEIGGLVATTIVSDQQWDKPNGWAPLHYIAIVGLRNYGYHELASEIRRRWLNTVELVYKERGKLVEKYDVIAPHQAGTGGEYSLQDGFGWTNGVTAALLAEH